MNDDLKALKASTDAALADATDLRTWDAVRIAVLGRGGSLTAMLRDLGKTPPEQRKDRGAALNRPSLLETQDPQRLFQPEIHQHRHQ